MSTPKSFYLYDAATHRFHELTDGFTVGRESCDVTCPDDDQLAPVHLRVQLGPSGVSIIDVSEPSSAAGSNAGRVRLNTWPIDRNNPRRIHMGDLIGVGNQRFILTNQNLYRPSPALSASTKTLVRPSDPTVLLPETIKENASSNADESETIELQVRQSRRKTSPARRKSGKKWIPAFIAAGVAFLVIYEPTSPIRKKAASVDISRLKKNLDFARAKAPAADPNPLNLSAAFPGRPSGIWEAKSISGVPEAPRALYLKNVAMDTRHAPLWAMRESTEVLKTFFSLPVQGLNEPFGKQPELEAAADVGCEHVEASSGLPQIQLEHVVSDVLGTHSDLASELLDDKAGPLPLGLFNARLSTLRYPLRDSRIEITSSVVSCDDPPGRRFAFAQQKASLYHALKARLMLAGRVTRHEAHMTRNVSNKYSREAIKGMKLSSQVKGFRNLRLQLAAYTAWLASEGAQSLPHARQVTAEANQLFSGYLENEIADLQQAYDKGAFVYPTVYPPIKTDALLDGNDLLFLSAY